MRVSSVNKVIDMLIAYIDDNNLVPNDRIPTEKEICEQLGVGRSTVREAYKVMQARGIIYAVQGKGVFVNDTFHLNGSGKVSFENKQEEFSDYMDVRTSMEKTAVRIAILRATPEQVHQLELIEEEFEEGLAAGNVWVMAEKDEQFHSTIALITQNPLIVQINDLVSNYFRTFRIDSFRRKDHREHAVSPHRMIIQAFREKNPELGELIIGQHMNQSAEDFASIMKQTKKKPARKKA